MEKKSNKLLIVFIFIITAGLAGAAVWIGWRLSQEEEVTPQPSEAAVIWTVCNGNGGDGWCSGSANSGANCNNSCAGVPPAGYMWSCWDRYLNGDYRCYPQTTNEGGSQCYCFQSPCTDSSNWAECGCRETECVAECERQLAGMPGQTYWEITWLCEGCQQYFTCSCTQQVTTTTSTTATTSTTVTTQTTQTTSTTQTTTTTQSTSTTSTTIPGQTTTTSTSTTTSSTTSSTTETTGTTETTTTTESTTTTTTTIPGQTTTTAPHVGIFDDALEGAQVGVILIILGTILFALNPTTLLLLPLKQLYTYFGWEGRKERFEKKAIKESNPTTKKK